MTHLTDPSRFVGRRVEYTDAGRSIPATVLAVGIGGVVLAGPDGGRLVEPAKLHRLHVVQSDG